ncbi:MAG: ribonuclease III [Flavobacteriales bacterium]
MNWFRKLFPARTAHPENRQFIQKKFGISVSNTSLYEEALRHSSASISEEGRKNNNERLEFLGDSVLDAVVADYLYNKYPHLPEGELTKMKSKVVRRENLNDLGRSLGLEEQIKLNIGKQPLQESMLGNAFEALVGAMYMDKGFGTTRKILIELLKKHGLDTKVHDLVDYKSKLQEWAQKNKKHIRYEVVEEKQNGGKMNFKISLRIDFNEWSLGEGGSKKVAEQRAAEQACKKIFHTHKSSNAS